MSELGQCAKPEPSWLAMSVVCFTLGSMDVLTEPELKACFKDEDDIWFPDLSVIEWADLDFLGWVHPSGHLGYIATRSPNDGRLRGIVLRRFERPTPHHRFWEATHAARFSRASLYHSCRCSSLHDGS